MSKKTLKTISKLIDIGANLTDPMFQGIYNGTKKHKDDFNSMMERAFNAGLQKIIITSGCHDDVVKSLELISSDDRLYTTIGCHPTRCNEMRLGGVAYIDAALRLASENKSKIVAVGECGLDYDRLHFCEKEIQLKYFEEQFFLVDKTELPMFLHCRNAAKDFVQILDRNKHRLRGGVVHSFDGDLQELNDFLNFGLYIGINGCSLKTESNLNVVSKIPLDRLLIETDAPWCEVKPTHAGFKYVKTFFPSRKKEKFEENLCVKGRNEPCNIQQIVEILSSLRSEDQEILTDQILKNTKTLFKFE